MGGEIANRKALKGDLSKGLKRLAGGRGVEPRFAESESGVLPLNDPPNFVSVSVIRGC